MSDDLGARKRKRVRLLQRYLLNPPAKLMAWAGLLPGHVLIETKGRRSGKRRRTVVGMHIDGDTGWVVAEQGRHANYVRNLMADPRVRVKVGDQWLEGRAQVLADDDPVARLKKIGGTVNGWFVRAVGTELLTVRIDLEAPQTSEPPASGG